MESLVSLLRVVATPSADFIDSLSFQRERVVRNQKLWVSGRTKQCHIRHVVGHAARDC